MVEETVVILHKLRRDAKLVVGLGVKVILVELEHARFENVIFRLHEVGVRPPRSTASVPGVAEPTIRGWKEGMRGVEGGHYRE